MALLSDEPYPDDEYELMVLDCPCTACDCYVLTEDGELCPSCAHGIHPGADE